MNERIKELAELARQHAESKIYLVGWNYNEQYNQKFAELIVNECAELLKKEAESSHDEGTESYNALIRESQWIKRYFGIDQ